MDASAAADLYIRELAFWTCVWTISNALSNCEFKTYRDNKEVRDREYYLWNREPNRNQSSSAFLSKLIAKLYGEGECLVVEWEERLFVCDAFTVESNVLYGNRYSDVTIDGYQLVRSFDYDQVLHYRLTNPNVHRLLNNLYDSYQKLIASSMKGHNASKGFKGKYTYESLPPGINDQEQFAEYIKRKFRNFIGAEDAVFPLGKGEGFESLMGKTTQYGTTRDIRAQIDDVFDYSARALLIPPSLVNGSVQETSVAMDQFLTLCIKPLAGMLEKEINRKKYKYQGFRQGNYLKIDTRTVKHIDLLNAAPNIERLISSGPYSINDLRRLVGDVPIDEPWADEHFITRNFATADEMMQTINNLSKEDSS